MRNILSVLLICSLAFVPACDKSNHNRRHKHQKKHVKVHHLENGRYCYFDDNTHLWYWLVLHNSTDTKRSDYYYTSSGSNVSASVRPSGYTWVSVKDPENKFIEPEENEIDNNEFIIEEEIVVDEYGNIEVDGDGNLVDPDQMAPDDGYGCDSGYDSSDSYDSGDSGDSGSDGSD